MTEAHNSNTAQTDPPKKRKVVGRPFVKGQPSPNPGGKPKDLKQIVELARSFAPAAIKALADIAIDGRKEETRIAAAEALLTRGYGRPVLPVAFGASESDLPALIRHIIIDPVNDTETDITPSLLEGTAINADDRCRRAHRIGRSRR